MQQKEQLSFLFSQPSRTLPKVCETRARLLLLSQRRQRVHIMPSPSRSQVAEARLLGRRMAGQHECGPDMPLKAPASRSLPLSAKRSGLDRWNSQRSRHVGILCTAKQKAAPPVLGVTQDGLGMDDHRLSPSLEAAKEKLQLSSRCKKPSRCNTEVGTPATMSNISRMRACSAARVADCWRLRQAKKQKHPSGSKNYSQPMHHHYKLFLYDHGLKERRA